MKNNIIIPFFTLIMAVGVFTFIPSKRAQACCYCVMETGEATVSAWNTTQTVMEVFIRNEFAGQHIWFVSLFWEDNVLPAMMMMAEQLSAVAMQQAMIIGTFFDAKHQLETQQVFQEIRARAHKDYHPSNNYGLCEIGTTVKSLAASDRRADFTALVLSQRSQDRNLGNTNTLAAKGNAQDKTGRRKQYREKFCDVKDNDNGLYFMCKHEQSGNQGASGAMKKERMNKDIDFSRTVDYPWTLDLDFTDTKVTEHEEEVLALAANLYAHDVFKRPTYKDFRDSASADIAGMKKLYLDMRSLIAKRSVAENSFNAITGLKAQGAPGSREYMLGILNELGIPPKEARILLSGDTSYPDGGAYPEPQDLEPSYYAQMEILTKKIYQNPDFYTHLYDKPANVARREVAMQAVGLMQKFDLFKSYLRSEASLSVLLELAVMEEQDAMEGEINKADVIVTETGN